MSTGPKRRELYLACMVLAAGLALPSGIESVGAAEQTSAEQIIKALTPPRITRGLSTSPADAASAAEETRFIDTLRNRPTRSLSHASTGTWGRSGCTLSTSTARVTARRATGT